MTLRSRLVRMTWRLYERSAWLREALIRADSAADRLRYRLTGVFPQVIRADPRALFVSLTSRCNFRCKGCHYGREFMAGAELPLPLVRDLLDDARAIGFDRVRLYGGEPLLHRDLPEIVAHATRLGLRPWLTTNGLLLRRRIDDLFEAGLREVSLGFYGNGAAYDTYVQREHAFARVEEGIAHARQRYGSRLSLTLGWVLMRPTCTPEALADLTSFARTYRLPIHVNLFHYSLPYFVRDDEDHARELGFGPEDRPAVERAVDELLALKASQPELVPQSAVALRSIPDWMAKGPDMRVPCDAYRLVWVGPDGTVQLCYVTFKLGNLHEARLRDLVFSRDHQQAAHDAFSVNCPNCSCGWDKRVLAHGPTRRLYLAGRA
jgi:MoaA/NifB/PqqE/SkfB family radical SAM enzyme